MSSLLVGALGTRPAKEATSTIPIVMTSDEIPLGWLRRQPGAPGGNITGLTNVTGPEWKTVGVLQGIVPRPRKWPSSGLRLIQQCTGFKRDRNSPQGAWASQCNP